MPALNQPYEAYERPGLVVNYPVSAVQIWKGALVGVNSSGFLVPMAHGTVGLRFVGVANDSVSNVGGTPGARSVNVTKSGAFVYAPVSGLNPTRADIGREVLANTDNDVQFATTGLTNVYRVGTLVAIEAIPGVANGLRIRIDNFSV